jgi:sterol desaturase/sphingolipid hydroxylase (fatty acid hydroxylase superfamily)
MFDPFLSAINQLQGAVFETAGQPVLYQLGLMDWSDDLFDGTGFAIFGAIEIVVAFLLFRPLEWLRPAERWSDGRAVRTDIVYTLVTRLGLLPLIVFLLLTPIGATIDGFLRFQGYIPPTLDQLVPVLRDWPLALFAAYLAVIDLAEYWRHRLQHRLGWWWALHSIHHDQRQMTFWADDRNHVLDLALAAVWRGTVALLIGVPPAEYPLVMIGFHLIENLSHANLRAGFGRVGSALVVGPQYHRLHHAVEHARPPFDRAMGCNFAVLFPVWDVVFGTWRREAAFPETGVAGLAGAETRCGYLRHQIEGFRRLAAELARLVDRRHPGFPGAVAQRRAAPAGEAEQAYDAGAA